METSSANKLRNLFEKYTDHNCFVCSKNNKIGLKLEIIQNNNNCYADLILGRNYSGFPDIVHGGIQAAILDEVAFWAMFNKYKSIGFTTKMNIQYLNKMDVNKKIRAIAINIIMQKNNVNVKVELREKDKTLTKADVDYRLVNDIYLKKYFGDEFLKEFIKIKNEKD